MLYRRTEVNEMNLKRRKIKIINTIITLSFLFFIVTQYDLATWQQCLLEQHTQPVFLNNSQGGYYPSVIFDPASFGEDTGTIIGSGPNAYTVRPYYKMWFSDGTIGGLTGFAYSEDGINWNTCSNCSCSGLANPHHVAVVYTGSTYMIWYWDTSELYTHAAIRTAVSADGLNWSGDQASSGNLITGISPDWNRGSYGPCQVFYNPTASDTGTNPFKYSFIMYFDGTTGGFEETGLGYSPDGINWQLYGKVLARGNSGPWGNTGDWDSSYASRGTVVKVSKNEWHMWYSGGQTTMNQGIGHASSSDGIHWTRDPANPVLHINDGLDYRNSRTYTPWVIFREDRFQGRGDSIKFKGWFSARGDSGLKTVCHLGTGQLADLSLTKSVDNSNPGLGDNILYTITVSNSGIAPATGVYVTELLPAGLTFISASTSSGAYDDTTGLWQIGAIAVNNAATLQITARVDQTGTIMNTAEITAADTLDPDSDPGDNDPGEDDRQTIPINADSPPTANAGRDRTQCAGAAVILDGTGSFDPDGDTIRYNWRFISIPANSNAVLYAAAGSSPYFTPDIAGEYHVRLTITDPYPVALTASDDVIITAETCNQAPVAVISGESDICSIPAVVELSAENSYDPDGEIAAYKWEILKKPAASTAQLSSLNTVKTSFTADLPGVYSIALLIKDNLGQWSGLTTKAVTAHIGTAPEIIVEGTRHSERAWIIRQDYFKISVKIRQVSACPVQIEKYLVYRKAAGGNFSLIKELTLTDFSLTGQVYMYEFTDKFFNRGTAYTYRVAAIDPLGQVTAYGEKLFL
jgi:uncharacterized repeat protein (TIGR01451 family)